MFLKLCFSARGRFGNVWGHFWLSQLGRGCYWHLVGKDQRCCSTSIQCTAQPPTIKNDPGKISVVPQGRSLLFGFFKAKCSQICFTVPVINSMPDISKRKEKGKLHCKTFTAVALSLKIYIYIKQNHYKNLESERQSKPV